MMPLRITFLLTQSVESPSGLGRYLPLAKALVANGFSVTILALHHNFVDCAARDYYEDGVHIRYVGQMHVRKVANTKIYYGRWGLLYISLLATVRLWWAGMKSPCDLIHICKPQPMNILAARAIGWMRRLPIFVDCDDCETAQNRFQHGWQQKIVAWFEDSIVSFASGITVGNSFMYERLQSLGYPAERIRLIRNGVERKRFQLPAAEALTQHLQRLRQQVGIQAGDRVILYIGTISFVSHALDLLLEAFVIVAQQIPNALLLIVGSGEDFAEVQHLADRLGIAARTRFAGRIAPADIPFYFQLAEVSVDPRRDLVSVASSLSLKVVESIASSIPCITTDVGDRRLLVGESGLVVPPDDALALAQAIQSVLQNSTLAATLRTQAKGEAEQHFWENKAQEFALIYSHLGQLDS